MSCAIVRASIGLGPPVALRGMTATASPGRARFFLKGPLQTGGGGAQTERLKTLGQVDNPRVSKKVGNLGSGTGAMINKKKRRGVYVYMRNLKR